MGLRDLFIKSKSVELEVRLDKAAYLPGETVTATIALSGKKDLAIEEGRAELVYENEYTYSRTESDNDGGSGTEDETTTDRVAQAVGRFLERGSVGSGARDEYTVNFPIPSDAIPSGEGEITKVRWMIKAILSRRRARDPDADATFTVFSPRERYAPWAQRPSEIDAHIDLDLELRVTGSKDLRSGDTVSGTFVVTPRSELDAQEVRVELVRREEVRRARGKENETVEARTVGSENPELTVAVPHEYPFEFRIPHVICPSLETEQSSVRWYVRGVVARRLRSDYNIRQELNVYTAPAS